MGQFLSQSESRNYRVGQRLLQSDVGIAMWCNYYELGKNRKQIRETGEDNRSWLATDSLIKP